MEEEKKEIVTLGTSLLVPSVIEVAKESPKTVPSRYVQNEITEINCTTDDDIELPVINMQSLLAEDESELQKLDTACKEWGFFQLINHGVSSSLVEKLKTETREFFNLPLEEKKKYWQTTSDIEGYGQVFVKSEEQKLDWADMFYFTTLPKHQRRANLLPMLPLPYRETLDSYSEDMKNLAQNIIDCMAKALSIDVEAMREIFGEGYQAIRLNYYPPCPQPEKVIGLTHHSDVEAITILLHVDEVEGLQVKKDDKWILIKPVPNAFVINVGDVLEIVSNGIYQSVLHRAIVNAFRERITVATFYTPSNDSEIGPFPCLITAENPAKFKRIGIVDLFNGYLAKHLEGKSYLDAMKINEN